MVARFNLLVLGLIVFAAMFIYFAVNIIQNTNSLTLNLGSGSFIQSYLNMSNTETNNNIKSSDYRVLFLMWDSAALISHSQNASLSSWPTMSASLQYYYTSIHKYDYMYFSLNKAYSVRASISECVYWRYKNGTYKFRLQANYCKILIIYHVLLTYWDKYDFIVYLDSDAYVRTMNVTFKQWISKHFEIKTHRKSINDYAMIFVSQKPYEDICTCFIIMPTVQLLKVKEILKYWYARIGYEKKDYWDANHVQVSRDQGVFNNQVYVIEKYRNMMYEIDENQIYDCKHPERYNKSNPYFIHFHSFLRRRSVAKKCGTYLLYYEALKSVNIYHNITKHVDVIRKCCVRKPNFKYLQEFIYA
eukprot:282802_1